jgi:PAS domain S-box-containing protein
MFSFLPTGIMLSGLGIRIAIGKIDTLSVLYYIIFGSLLVIALIDHKHFLMFPETIISPIKEQVLPETLLGKPIISKPETQVPQATIIEKPIRIEGIDEILTLHKETLSNLNTLIKDDLQRAEAMMKEIENKAIRIDHLGEEIEKRRRNLVREEMLFKRRFISSLDKDIQVRSIKQNDESNIGIETGEDVHDQHTMLDDFIESAAIVQRGILKQVNQQFIELLGYEKDMILDTSLLNFIAPEGLSGIEGYYLNRLKGEKLSTYRTIVLTKDNIKLPVKINIKPIIINGKKAEIAVIKKLDKTDGNEKLK